MRQLSIWLILLAPLLAVAADMNYGRFTGSVKTEWLRGSATERRMRLLEDFAYVDPKGKTWLAPKGSVTDGASIPRGLWTIVGAPFEGQYREAAVIHDVYCETKTERHQDVHRIFYYASRAAGVSEFYAKVLYGGVVAGGPKWSKGSSNCFVGCHAAITVPSQVETVPKFTEDDAKRLASWIEAENPSLEEIDAFVALNFRPNKAAHP
ncbi:MAG: DUF1353 domain-containing protein [Burkholderiales bacterium]|nr:DUF1353 domain-containing protein [Burkholderiales bacterium]